MAVDLKGNPFFLTDEQAEWVEQTYKSMTLEEKIGQIMCPSLPGMEEAQAKHLTEELHVGGMMIRPLPSEVVHGVLQMYQSRAKIPMLISANLENGGNGALADGTYYAMPEGCSATGNTEQGYRLGKVSCREAAAAGVTWGYAPLVDIDMNYRNPITNVRSFGSDPDTVIQMAKGYLKAAKEEGIAPTMKHFPGDGVDERDQHLLVSVNSLTYEEWMATYGRVYKEMIAAGYPSLMAAHISQPSVARHINPEIAPECAVYPGTLSRELLTGLLRGELGYNGLIVTDSTLMVGYMQCMPRKKAVPYCIECGCDSLLFNRNVDEDYRYLMDGYKEGILSEKRLEEAVLRNLALKAYLNLPEKQRENRLVPDVDIKSVINSEETKKWVKDCADHAVTLVKDNHGTLPLSPEKTKRIYLNVIENSVVNNSPFALDVKARLEKEGFEVTLRERAFEFKPELIMSGEELPPDMARIMAEVSASTEDFISQYDMAMIVLNMETVSNATVVRVDWKVIFGMGNDIPWYAGEMPLVVVSTANPYHLLDIPMADVYVNAYSGNQETVDAVFEKMMGRSEFKGISPVDAFCGHEDCKAF